MGNKSEIEEGGDEDSEDSVDSRGQSELIDVVRNHVKDAFFREDGTEIIKNDCSSENIKVESTENDCSSHFDNNNSTNQRFSCDEDNDSNDSSLSDTSTSHFRVSTENSELAIIPRGKLQCADCGKIVDAKFLHNHMQYVHRNVVHRKGRKGTLLPATKKEKPVDRNNGPYYFEKDIGIQCSLSPERTITSCFSKKRKLEQKYQVLTREGDSLTSEGFTHKGVRDASFQTVYDSFKSDSDNLRALRGSSCSPDEPVLFVCFRCFQDFPSRDSLEEHVVKAHNNDDNLVKCHKCKEWVPFRSYKSHPNCWSPKSSVLTKEGKYNVLTIGKPEESATNHVIGNVCNGKQLQPNVTLSMENENAMETSHYLSLNSGHIVDANLESSISDNNMRIYQLDPGDIHSLNNTENGQEEIIANNEGQIVIIKKGPSFDSSNGVTSDANDDEPGKMFFHESGSESGGDQVLDVVVNVNLESVPGCDLNTRISCDEQLSLDGGRDAAFLHLHSGDPHGVLSLHGGQHADELLMHNAASASVLDSSGDALSVLGHRDDGTSIINTGNDGASVLGHHGDSGSITDGQHGDSNTSILDPRPDQVNKGLGLRGGGTAVLGLRDNGTSALGLRGDDGTPVLVGGPSLAGIATKLSLRTECGMEGDEETTATIVLGKANEGSIQLPVTAEAMQLGQEYVDLATGTKYMVVIEENSDPNSGKIILQP